MDAISPVNTVQAPLPTADMRPTADVAAFARDPQPELPMPFPASLAQAAEVNQSRISASANLGQVEEIERVLKPFNVSMLPHDPGESGQEDDVTADEDAALLVEAETIEDDAKANDATEETEALGPNDISTETQA